MATFDQHQVRIIDATLREGAQAPGVRFLIDESCEIARSLVSIGVDMIECGHPRASDKEFRRVRAVVAASGEVPVLAHARATVDDINHVKWSGASWVGIFLGVNRLSQECRFSIQEPLSDVIIRAVIHAKELGLKVRFTVEDASRTEWDQIESTYGAALESGADRICFADTVGILCPWEVEDIVGRLCRRFKGHDLEVHFHDDRGFANANAIVAVKAGADWVSASVNGIGERCGITDTLNLSVNLSSLGWRQTIPGTSLKDASSIVQAHSRLQLDRWRPLLGHNAYIHVAKLHQQAVLINRLAYNWIDPRAVSATTCVNPSILPSETSGLVNHAVPMSSTEMQHHCHGHGDPYLMLDDRVVPDARQYCTVRDISQMDNYEQGDFDTHRHLVDSLFLFIGYAEDLSGLCAEVQLGDDTFTVTSPCSVFIPSGVRHSYRIVSGRACFSITSQPATMTPACFTMNRIPSRSIDSHSARKPRS